MTNKRILHKAVTLFIAAVWLINGLFCKVLNLVPRHQQIVERILGAEYSGFLTKAIGLAEVAMAFWIISRRNTRLSATAQMALIATMNILEFVLAPDLLLWGKFNSLFAALFILLIYYNEFILSKTHSQQA